MRFSNNLQWGGGEGACNNRTVIDDVLFQRHERSRTNQRVADDGQDGAQDHNLLGIDAGVADISDDGCYYCVRPAADDEHEAHVDGRKSKLRTSVFKNFFLLLRNISHGRVSDYLCTCVSVFF